MSRVLLIRLTALGDVILVEPVVRAVRRLVPGAEVELLTEARYAVLGAEAFGVRRIHGWDRRGADRGLGGVGRVRRRIEGAGFEVVIDLQNKLRTRALVAGLNARTKLRASKRGSLAALAALFGHDPPVHDRYAVELYLAALAPLGGQPQLEPGELAPRLTWPADQGGARGGLALGVAPGASHATKLWPADRFGQLLERVAAARPELQVTLIGGPGERALFEAVRGAAPGVRFSPVDTSALDVAGLAQVLAGLDLLLSVDTGPAHLGAALGVPTLVLFGPTSWVRWGPRGRRHRALSLELDCAPCSNVGGASCPRADRAHACLQGLSVEAVEAALVAHLAALGAPSA